MRRWLIGALTLMAAACGGEGPQQTQSDAGCARTATREVIWSDDQAPDTVTATASGPTCAQTVVTLVIRSADGEPLWAFASTYYDMIIGGRGEPIEVSEQDVDRFLAGWADVSLNTSGALPEWPEGAASPGEAVEGMAYYTEFDRETYNSLRARNLRQLCFAAAVEASQCLVIDPLSHAPAVLVAFGV
jgi:hypothetical protein